MKSRLTVEGKDKVVPVQIMMVGIRGWGWWQTYSPLILNLGNRWGERSASHSSHFTADEITYGTHRTGLRAGLDA